MVHLSGLIAALSPETTTLCLDIAKVAKANGAQDMESALEVFKDQLRPDAKLVIAWGDKGACAYDKKTAKTFVSPAFPPESGVVDTLGAGDTFNACVIGGLSSGLGLEQAVGVACRVAGAKVGQRGFQGLREVYQMCKAE